VVVLQIYAMRREFSIAYLIKTLTWMLAEILELTMVILIHG